MAINRRQVLRSASVGLVAMVGERSMKAQTRGVKAMVFDTFGTVVDWRGSIIAEGAVWGKTKGLTIDWARFADRWRGGYAPAMDKVRKGEMPWTKLDVLHRMMLEDVLKEFGITGLTEAREGSLEPRLAQAEAVARFRRGPRAVEEEVHDRSAVEWERIASRRHGQECGPALGPDPWRRSRPAL